MIDNAEKRRSAGGVIFLPLGPGVTPNAAKDAQWRAQSAWSYSGIIPDPPDDGNMPHHQPIQGMFGRCRSH